MYKYAKVSVILVILLWESSMSQIDELQGKKYKYINSIQHTNTHTYVIMYNQYKMCECTIHNDIKLYAKYGIPV